MGTLGNVSDAVGLGTTMLEMCGVDIGDIFGLGSKPPYDEILNKLDQALSGISNLQAEIGNVATTLDKAISLIEKTGENILEAIDGTNQQINWTYQAQALTQIRTALAKIADYDSPSTSEVGKELAAAEAKTKIDEAIGNILQQAQNDTLGVSAGAVVSAVSAMIVVVERFDDSAFATPKWKGYLENSADALRDSVTEMEAAAWKKVKFEMRPEGYEGGMELHAVSAFGVEININTGYLDLNIANANGSEGPTLRSKILQLAAANPNGALAAVLTFLDGYGTAWNFHPSDTNYSSWDPAYAAQSIAYGASDLRAQVTSLHTGAMSTDLLRNMADAWDYLASGAHVIGTEGADTRTSTSGKHDVLDGGAGDDVLTGGVNADTLRGGSGNDVLNGGGSDDVIRGDDASGAQGDDVINGGAGSDRMDGGGGVDTLSYAGATGGVTVNLTLAARQATGGSGSDQIKNFENVVGSDFGDTLTGDSGANLIDGAAGNDTLNGGIGHDTLLGGAGDDTLNGGDGNDTLVGGAGNDALNGGAGQDTARLGSATRGAQVTLNGDTAATVNGREAGGAWTAEDTIAGVENLVGGAAADELTGDGLANEIEGGAGDDVVKGGAGNDRLWGDDQAATSADGADLIDGGAGEDVFERVSAGGASDQLTGGFNIDTFVLSFAAGNAADVVTDFRAGAGGDLIDLSALSNAERPNAFGSGLLRLVRAGADTLLQIDVNPDQYASDYRTALVLKGVNASLLTTDNFAQIVGFSQRPWPAFGSELADSFVGTSAVDLFDGLGGDDVFKGGAGADVFDGGAGVDLADFRDKAGAVQVALNGANDVTVKVGGVDEDTLRNVEWLYGGTGNDILTGDGFANLFRGGLGRDLLTGGGGLDTADYGDKTTAVAVTLAGAANATVSVGGVAEDTVRTIENVVGGSAADTLNGDALANVFRGGGGADVLDGAGGVDTADFSDKTAAVVLRLTEATLTTSTVGGVAEDKVRNIENVIGGSGGDRLTGDALANALSGGAGDDVLIGGLGADRLDGGAGKDVADYRDKTAALSIGLRGALDASVRVGGVAEDLIRNIESIYAGSGADTLVGDEFDNVLSGGAGDDAITGGLGADTLDGAEGRDTLNYRDRTQAVSIVLNGASATTVRVNGVAEDSVKNFEVVFGGQAGDVLTGDAADNTLYGDGGDDVLKGGAGRDLLDGGAGVDRADYGDKTTAVVVTLIAGSAVVARVGGVSEDTLRGIELVTGGSAGDVLTGDAGANTLQGGAGDDTLNGGLGADLLEGGSGRDIASYRGRGDAVSVTLNGASDGFVRVNDVLEDTLRGIETVIGGSINDTMIGDAGGNRFYGENGDDVLQGGRGSDLLDGGAGFDTADYSDRGSVTITLSADPAASVTAFVEGGVEDSLRGIEAVTGGWGGDVLTGSAGENRLRGGEGADTLDGGAGHDLLDGGEGSDTVSYRGRTEAFSITLNGANTGLVYADGLVEDVLEGVENLVGGSAGDTLIGDDGANRLDGGAGPDTLTGGAGQDEFIFTAHTPGVYWIDTIIDFEMNELLDLSGIDANPDEAGDQGFHFNWNDPWFSGAKGELILYPFGPDGQTIYGDVDGDMVADFEIRGADLEYAAFIL